jgi:DNA-binding IclR family transcriptional regulator
MAEENKGKVLTALEEAYPGDLSIMEVARRSRLSRGTASTWLRVLAAEGQIEFSRKVGPAVFYRAKK